MAKLVEYQAASQPCAEFKWDLLKKKNMWLQRRTTSQKCLSLYIQRLRSEAYSVSR